MTGEGDGQALAAGMRPHGAVLLLMGLALAGCGGLVGQDAGGAVVRASQAQAAEGSSVDVAAPDVFQVAERGLWDGRPSLGGVWVAHPDATDPERVRIVNRENGQEVVGALFRRERDLPGPALQVSSDAAEALGILAGAPTEIEVTALRRREAPAAEEAPEEAPAEATGAPTGEELAAALDAAPVAEEAPAAPDPAAIEAVAAATASILAAPEAAPAPEAPAEAPPAEPEPAPPPVAVDPAAIEAVARATAAILANAAAAPAPDAGEIATTTLDGAASAATAVPADAAAAVPADAPAAVPADPDGAFVQLGLFDVEANATAAAQALAAQGLPAQVVPSGDAWRLILGPAATQGDQAALLRAAVAAGFADAYLVSQ